MNLAGITIIIHIPSNHNQRSHTKSQHGGIRLGHIERSKLHEEFRIDTGGHTESVEDLRIWSRYPIYTIFAMYVNNMNLVGIKIIIHIPSNHNPRSHTKSQNGGIRLGHIERG